MAGGREEVGFEVRVLQGDTWQIHARYSKAKQRTAVEDAKSLEKISTIKAVKVVRETYNQETGLSNDVDVYKSPSLVAEEQREAAERRAQEPSESPAPSSSARRRTRTATKSKQPAKREKPKAAEKEEPPPRPGEEKPRKKRSVFAGIIKLLLVVMVSIVLATLVMELASVFLSENRSLGARMGAGTRANVLIGVFVAAFLLSAFSMVSAFIKRGDLDISLDRRRPAARPSTPAERPKKPASVEEAAPAADKAPPAAESPATETPGTESPAAKAPAAVPLSTYGQTQKVYMMKFLGESLKKVKAGKRTMDNYNLFGVNMYLAGACEALGQERKLDVRSNSVILGEAVQAMGYKKNQAQSFADNYVEYLVADSRYMQMYQAGRNAMNTSLGDDPSSEEHLEKALVEWNKPKVKDDKAGPVTVMFTDMVGSTNLTQTKGDEVAQQVVRAHNKIVRDALTRYVGKEIKHTGDGIMASFAITSNGVEAALLIQHEVVKHNERNPDLPLHLKIGINAGEPIAEDDDLFGTTVQVAARTVDKAQSEQIFVTEIVHGICAGKGLKFINRGQFPMKGVTDPITLYEAVWDESILADEAAAAEEAAPVEAEEARDAAADTPEAEPAEDAAKTAPDEAAVDEPEAEPGADEKEDEPEAEETAPSPVEEIAETDTAPPQEAIETQEEPLPEDAQQPSADAEEPSAEEPSAEPDGKPGGEEKT